MPQTREIKGKLYRLVVLRVTGWDDLGRPAQATIGYDDTTFDLRDDRVSREFVTAFIPDDVIKPKTRSH